MEAHLEMAGYCKVIILGNLTRSPELKYTPSGTPVASLGLAANHKYKKGDELKEEVCFVDVVVFGKQAENVAQYTDKGDSILVEGRLQQRRWETEDGQKRSKHEIVAGFIKFIRTKRHNGDPNDPESSEQPSYEE